MKGVVIALGLVLALATVAWAQSPPVNPKEADWTAPTTNLDGTPLSDLAGYTLRVRATPTGPVLKSILHPSPTTTPVPNTTVIHGSTASPLVTELNLPDGSYLLTVTAVDTSFNESPESGQVPFVSNRVSPAVPTGVLLK